jgi:hypothetical protein
MKKMMLATLPVLALSLATPVAHADNDPNAGSALTAVNNWNFTAAAVCLQEAAVVPVLGDWVGDHQNNCSNGNVIDHLGR